MEQMGEWPIATHASSPVIDQATQSKKRRPSQGRLLSRRLSENNDPLLACLNCRQKKVKCQLGPGGCTRCVKLGLQCVEPEVDERKRPSSKNHIKELYERISYLEEELRKARNGEPPTTDRGSTLVNTEVSSETGLQSDLSTGTAAEKLETDHQQQDSQIPLATRSESLIARLCGSRWQLNSDEEGQLHFYGPTSSLHLTENISSSILQGADHGRGIDQHIHDVAPDLQLSLLDLYWNYQNPILQVVHKEAFLNDMATGQTRYYSPLLLYCIFACAARISDRPDIRALAVPQDDDLDEEQPYFIKRATELLERELKRPQITTVQSLQLLSVLDCARSNDTKGWMFAGDACRLAFDLGLHRDCSGLQSLSGFTEMDLEARSVIFWGCFVFDRLWAMYLGRPCCIKLDDVSVPRPAAKPNHPHSWDLKIAAAWADLLEIVGHICDALNGNHLTTERTTALSRRLDEWYNKLDVELRPDVRSAPAVFVLHMQYNSAVILLNRPLAGFGAHSSHPRTTALNELESAARTKCVQNAIEMTKLLQGYENTYGDASSLSGVALHPISTAATVLISEIVDRKGLSTTTANTTLTSQYLRCIKRCIKSLSELDKTYPVARRVRKMIQLIMRLSNVNDRILPKESQTQEFELPTRHNSLPIASHNHNHIANFVPTEVDLQQQHRLQHNSNNITAYNMDTSLSPTNNTSMPDLPAWDTSWSPSDLFSVSENTPMTSQMDILYSFDSFFGNEYKA